MNEKEFFVSVSSDKSALGTIHKYETRSQKVVWVKKDECYHGLTMSSENYLAAFSPGIGNQSQNPRDPGNFRYRHWDLEFINIKSGIPDCRPLVQPTPGKPNACHGQDMGLPHDERHLRCHVDMGARFWLRM